MVLSEHREMAVVHRGVLESSWTMVTLQRAVAVVSFSVSELYFLVELDTGRVVS